MQSLITAQADLALTDKWNRTPSDVARELAMQPLNPRYRKKAYEVCTILEQAGAPSSVTLLRMPSDATMDQECTIANRKYERESRFGSFGNFDKY